MAEEKLVWNEKWPTKIRIGAGGVGGGFYMAASAFANVLKEEFPELEVIVEQTKASVHNIKLMEANEVEFAMCTPDTTYEAWTAQGSQWEGKEYKGARIVMPAWLDAMIFVTLKKIGITDITQFTGNFSALGKGSQCDIFMHKVFETFGNKVQIVNLSPEDSVLALQVGSIEGFILGHPSPAVSELALTNDIQIINITKEQAEYFLKKHPEYSYPATVPGGFYKGLDESISVFGAYDIIIARDDLPEDMVYTVLKAMYKHQEIVEETWPIFGKGMKDLSSVKLSGSTPFHKGSIRYYKEIGVELSEAATSLDE
jgi:hypothetical protein